MNTAKIAARYPYFLDALRQLHTNRSLEDMMATVEQALLLKTNVGPRLSVKLRDQDNPVHRFDELGLPSEDELRELVSSRQFNWVCQQLPAQPIYSDDLDGMLARYEARYGAGTGWRVTAHAVMPVPVGRLGQVVPATRPEGQYLTWTGSEQELVTLLRGLRAMRTKRRKRIRKLIAQLWAYYLRQSMCQHQLVAVATDAAEGRIAA